MQPREVNFPEGFVLMPFDIVLLEMVLDIDTAEPKPENAAYSINDAAFLLEMGIRLKL